FRLTVRNWVRSCELKLLFATRRTSHRFPKCEHVRSRMREEAKCVKALGQRQHTLHRQKIVGWLEASNTAIRCGPNHRSPGLFTDREGHHPRSHRCCGTARTATRRMLHITRVPSWPRSSVGKGSGNGFAQQDCPATAQVAYDGSVC